MKKTILFLSFLPFLLMSCGRNQEIKQCAGRYKGKSFNSLTDYVDPFIGTGGHGHTYPGASMPFGMVQLSPDTRLEGWDGCSGYHYSDTLIFGFSHTHLSGTGCSDYGDILFMPVSGDLKLSNGYPDNPGEGYGSTFSHENESARPGYYRVQLDKGPVLAELTATVRAGFHRYLFPEGKEAHLILDLTHRDEVIDSEITISGSNEVSGFRRSKAWAEDQHVYFVAQFSKPFKNSGISSDNQAVAGMANAKGKNLKSWFSFDHTDNAPVLLKVGISAVSVEGARKNLMAEIPAWDFDVTVAKADEAWEKELSRIEVKGKDTADLINFYTALYHAFLCPNVYMDVDSLYRGRDLQIHKASGFTYYTVFSLWDTYRALHPLFTLVQKERTNDFIQTFIAQYQQGGMLPVWELGANETGCMIGYHSIPVIADAFVKGISRWDAPLALQAMVHSARQDHLGLKYYKAQGYIPSNKEGESVSKTLEYAYDDWCIAQMAGLLQNQEIYTEFIRRAQNYKNLFDPSTGFMRPKKNETFLSPFDPREVNFNFTEANCWQYTFYVPQDVNKFIEMLGGDQAFTAKLDELFSTSSETTGRNQADITGLIGQYAHGNEPSHHMAYLYSYAGQAWKTQKMTRKIMKEMYTPCPDGIIGNEDCGQMSAWYIFSALGFYPVTPASDVYVMGSPLFDTANIHFEDGTVFTIVCRNQGPANAYIQNTRLNGQEYRRSWVSHFSLDAGGELVFEMGARPNKQFGSRVDDRPFQRIPEEIILPVPFVSSGERTFISETTVHLGHLNQSTRIHYTTDGSQPGAESPVWEKSQTIAADLHLKAIAIDANGRQSLPVEAIFHRIPHDYKLELLTTYSSQYTAGGDLALIDGERGNESFTSGMWQGYEGVDLHAVIDMGKPGNISKVTAGFLQRQASWIFMPEDVSVAVSMDGNNFTELGTVANTTPADAPGSILRDFVLNTPPTEARYVRIIARNRGVCPDWHLGAGHKAWIFADELMIE